MVTPRLAVALPSYGSYLPADGWRRLLDVARAADGEGVDVLCLPDHVVMGPNTDRYRWGAFPFSPEAPWLEQLTVATALAAATDRCRIMTWILIAPLRNPVLLAKTAATIDVLSGGRLDLGVGTGWQREEYDALGIPFEARGVRLDDTMRACRVLWRDTPAAFESATVSFAEVWCEPKPLQPGGPPVWCSGTLAPATLARIVEYGAGWIPIMGAAPADIAADLARVRGALRAAGRDAEPFRVAAPIATVRGADGADWRTSTRRTLERLPELLDAGVDTVQLPLTGFTRDPAEAPEFFAALRAAWDQSLA